MECQPSRTVVLVAMYQRPSPSVSANFKAAPRMIAQIRTVPNSVPAVSEETMSPAPTPVAATTSPGPIRRSLLLQVEGTSLLAALPLPAPPVTSAISCPSHASGSHITYQSRSPDNPVSRG